MEVRDVPLSWPQTFSISLSISWVITGAFDGLLMTQASLPRDVVRAGCKAAGAELLTPIPTSYKWTLSSLVTPVASSQHDRSSQ